MPLQASNYSGSLALALVVSGLIGLVACFALPAHTASKPGFESAISQFAAYLVLAVFTALSVGFGELFLASYVGVYA